MVKNVRKIIIGDVHGCYNQLLSLLTKINFNKDSDRIIFVGDLTDRGPSSCEVVLYVQKLIEEMGKRCIYIEGNHENMLLQTCLSGNHSRVWRNEGLWDINGGYITKESFDINNCSLDDYSLWIRENTSPYYEDDDLIVVHAGITDECSKEDEETRLWDRNPFEEGSYSGKLTVVGHTPLNIPVLSVDSKWTPYDYDIEYELPQKGILDIDTGCVFDGKLTAMIVENKKMKFVS